MLLFAQLYQNINPKSKSTAGLEIVLLMAGAFLLGYLFHYIYCRYKHTQNQTVRPVVRPSVSRREPDDLTQIEGIGAKINDILQAAGVRTFDDLANAPSSRIKGILERQGSRYQVHDPTTWAKQASLARDGKWDELEKMQDRLKAGRA